MKNRNLPYVVKATCGGGCRWCVKLLTRTSLWQNSHSPVAPSPGLGTAVLRALSSMRFALQYYCFKLQIPDPNPSLAGGLGQN